MPKNEGHQLKTIDLPIIGQTLVGDAEPETEEFVIDPRPTGAKMKQYLKAYDLRVSGTVDEMLQRLIEYASDRARWKSQFQAARSRVRGSASGSRASRASAKRRQAAFGDDGDDAQPEYPSKKAAINIPDRRTSAQIERMRTTARRVIVASEARAQVSQGRAVGPSHNGAHPNEDDEMHSTAEAVDSTPWAEEQTAAISSEIKREQCRQRRELRQLRHSMELGMGSMQHLLLNLSTAATPPPNLPAVSSQRIPVPPPPPPSSLITYLSQDSTSVARVPHDDNGPTPCLSELSGSLPPPSLHPPLPMQDNTNTSRSTSRSASVPGEQMFVLQLDDNNPSNTISYTASELRHYAQSPPTVTFASDLTGLFHDWYDSDHILLGSPKCGIPVRLWDKVFKKRSGLSESRAWDSIRSQWHNLKYIVEKYEALGSSEATFWARFSLENGVRMNYKQILSALKEERDEERNRLAVHADNAKRFFNGDLSHPDAAKAFSYKKGGRWVTLSKPERIAEAWLKLLEGDDAIRARWESFSAAEA